MPKILKKPEFVAALAAAILIIGASDVMSCTATHYLACGY